MPSVARDLEFAISAFATVPAIVNPIGNIPFFYAVTEGYSREDRNVSRQDQHQTAFVLFHLRAVRPVDLRALWHHHPSVPHRRGHPVVQHRVLHAQRPEVEDQAHR